MFTSLQRKITRTSTGTMTTATAPLYDSEEADEAADGEEEEDGGESEHDGLEEDD